MLHFLKKYCVILFFATPLLCKKELHVVYHEKYNISFYGIENLLHSFDGKKYGKIYNAIKDNFHIKIHTPLHPISDAQLLTVHTQAYLTSLQERRTIAQVAEVFPFLYTPHCILDSKVLTPIKWATQGTLDALDLALQHGSGINLSGGYHHAKANKGEGFCFFSDIALAINKFHVTNPSKKVLIIDLDAHQGNGHESIFFNNKNVIIFDVYNMDMYRGEIDLYPTIKYNYPLRSSKLPTYYRRNPTTPALAGDINGRRYISFLKNKINSAITQEKPGLIIYIAGTDILDNDPLGRLNVNKQAIIERDEIVFKHALGNHIPIVMLLAGGYTQESANVVSSSIVNLQRKFFR